MNAIARLSLLLAVIFLALGGAGVAISGATAKSGLIVAAAFAAVLMIPFLMARAKHPAAKTVATVLSVVFALAIAGRFMPKVWLPAIKGESEVGLAGFLAMGMCVASILFFFLFRKAPAQS